jgi:glycosyltransferase involved in cell wall biosynthesis
VLFPSDWEEPFGLVMIEAMACGTPVVATPRGAVPEIVVDGETGFIVPVESYAEAAVEAIKRADELDRRALRRRVEERFSAEAMVTGYEAVYERVVTPGG